MKCIFPLPPGWLILVIELTLLLPATAQPHQRYSQRAFSSRPLSDYSVSLRGGLTQFYGELNRQDFQSVVGLGLTRRVMRSLFVGLDYSEGKLGGQKEEFFNSYFLSDYRSLELLGKWNLSEQFFGNQDDKVQVTAYTGVGLMMFSSEAFDLTTGERVRFTTSLYSRRNPLFLRWGKPRGSRPIRTTNERVIPLGVHLNYQVGRAWELGFEYRFCFVRSDKLDATSGFSLLNPEESTTYSDTPNDRFSFLSLSMTYRFRMKQKDRDKDGFRDDVDKCPDVPGPFSGCPDSDGDGMPDYVDKCPEEAGTREKRGCP